MRHYLTGLAPLFLLAACSGGGESAEDVAEGIEPGQWETTRTFTAIEMEGLPEELIAMMQEEMVNKPETDSRCITPEEAADPGGNFLAPEDAGEDCDFGDSSFEGGVIDISATCAAPEGDGSAELSMTGSYTRTTIDADISVEGNDPNFGAMRMAGTVHSERTGECEAETGSE